MNTFEIINILYNDAPKAYAIIKGNGVEGMLLVYSYDKGSTNYIN